jgi:proton-coupled amino acid transporter
LKITFGICGFYVLFACAATSALGHSLQTVLTSNLDQDSALTVAVQVAYIVAVLCTFPLQMFPVYAIVRSGLYKTGLLRRPPRHLAHAADAPGAGAGHVLGCGDSAGVKENAARVGLVAAMAATAVGQPDQLGHIVSLCGSLCGIPIGFVFPPLMHYAMTRSTVRACSSICMQLQPPCSKGVKLKLTLRVDLTGEHGCQGTGLGYIFRGYRLDDLHHGHHDC